MSPVSPAQRAITAFERVHDLMVTVHDRSGMLASQIDSAWWAHRHPLCGAAKVVDVGSCVAFDVKRLAHDLASCPEGRVHRCWAGVVEWVVPILVEKVPVAVVFAGARSQGQALLAVDAYHGHGEINAPPIDDESSQLILECLRQLAARLALWLQPDESTRRQPLPQRHLELIPDARIKRQHAIRSFIERHHQREIAVADLARGLGLSVGRTIHIVQACCGRSFVQLLRDTRLTAAAAALRHSDLDIASVALRCGFRDLSHFHRCFKRRFGQSPLRYRLHSGS